MASDARSGMGFRLRVPKSLAETTPGPAEVEQLGMLVLDDGEDRGQAV
jgi:hypothetical protein